MFTLKVGNAEQYQDIDQNETRLRVPFQILEDTGKKRSKVVLEKIESFPVTATEKEIVATLKRHLKVFSDEREREVESKERQAQLDAAQKVAGGISSIVIK